MTLSKLQLSWLCTFEIKTFGTCLCIIVPFQINVVLMVIELIKANLTDTKDMATIPEKECPIWKYFNRKLHINIIWF